MYNQKCEPLWIEKNLEHKLKEAADNKLGKSCGYLLNDEEVLGKASCVLGEFGENGENAGDVHIITWGEISPNSPNSPKAHKQKAIFPKDSILADFYDYAVTQTEGADCYIIGAILPIAASVLARNVWLPWGATKLYCNLFSMLAGKPGDRKSSTIDPCQSNGSKSAAIRGLFTQITQSGNFV